MCGIHGLIDSSLNSDQVGHVLHQMAGATAHRGPDFTGFYTQDGAGLAHNRLSIIDLSSDGNQPMARGIYSIVFNGEVYNYLEIKKELEVLGVSFSSHSDTEVVLASYIQWGASCVNRFIGMWAFAIYNRQSGKLFCSRDRFGIKPFYYIHSGSKFYFASEVKALRQTGVFRNSLNEEQVKRFVQLGWIAYRSETMYAEVQQLQAACCLTFENGNVVENQYWEIPHEFTSISDREAIDAFSDLFTNSLKLHIRSDVRIGATLSGGIDSSSIVSALLQRRIAHEIETFTVFYDRKGEIDERPFVNELVQKYGNQLKANYLKPNTEDVVSELDRFTHHQDFPIPGSSPISQYFIMKEIAKSGIKVILSGQGADDYLGGYMHAYYRLYGSYLKRLRFGKAMREARYQIKYQKGDLGHWQNVMKKSLAGLLFDENKLIALEFRRGNAFVCENDRFGIDYAIKNSEKVNAQHEAMMLYSNLPSLLHYEDRNSMAFSIESRVPFLDHRLVEFGFRLRPEFKIRDGMTKWILRESVADALPLKIKNRTDKVAFVTPGESKWLRNELSFLTQIDKASLPFIRFDKAQELLESFRNGDNRNAKLAWRIAYLNYWVKNFV